MPAIRWESGVLMKKLSVISLLVVGIILISGCIDEEKTNSKTSTSSESSINKTSKETSAVPEISEPELIPGEFDINITSYYFVYIRGNFVISVLLTLLVNIILTALGLRPHTPAEAPPLAGFNKLSPVAYNHNSQYLH
ncbi:MAG: hypothetical protein J5U19_15405, partial [Candidatus Methanoperedens sp.]|nr:hypothetical protein [Candidatus Methanoperedens sp.]